MKTLKLLQRNLLYILLTCVLCVGCSEEKDSEYYKKLAEQKAKEEKAIAEKKYWKVIVIDSCEYVVYSERSGHKGYKYDETTV